MRIEDALQGFVVQLQCDGRSPHTTAQIERHIRLLTAWLGSTGRSCEVETIRHEDVAGFVASPLATLGRKGKPRKPSTTNTLRSSVRVFFAFVHQAGYAPSNAARLVRRALCGSPQPKGLSDVDQARLLSALAAASTPAEKRDRVIIEMLLRAGPRIGSIMAARIEDLDLAEACLSIRRDKGQRPRTLYLPPPVLELLREHLGSRTAGPIFQGPSGNALTARHVARRLDGWCERVGIRRFAPHALRHTFATSLYRRTNDLLLVKAALGHASMQSTSIYAAISQSRLREAVSG